jgi:putative ABC transport system permease protein
MNLAIRAIRHDLGRFSLTAAGLGLLLAVVLSMSGIYNGLVADSVALPNALAADLWVVQRDTRGPFAEGSRLPRELETRARAVPGVKAARPFEMRAVQLVRPSRVRFTLAGLAWPEDDGAARGLWRGRPLGAAHGEMIADRSLGFALGERVEVGREAFTVVGLAAGILDPAGDPVAFVTAPDVERAQVEVSGEAMRLGRASRGGRAAPPGGAAAVAAILVDLAPGAGIDAVRAAIAAWPDVSVYTAAEERDFLVRGVIDGARRQIELFRALLLAISTIIMGLVIYTMTVEKLRSLALLKLLGAGPRVVLGLVLEEALILGAVAYAVGLGLAALGFSHFPRRVLVGPGDRAALGAIVVAISVVASVAGLRKALAADPGEVLAS